MALVLRFVGTRMLELYQRTDKFLLTALLLIPMIVYMGYIQSSISRMGAKYQNLTSPGFISKVLTDTAMNLLFPSKQQCGPCPCPKLCNETHNLYLSTGDSDTDLQNRTFVEHNWVVTLNTHEAPSRRRKRI